MCVNIFVKKKLLHYAIDHTTIHSIADTGLRSNSLAFCSSAEAHITHTLSTNAIECTYVQSIACVLNPHVTFFLGHFLPSPPHFSIAPYSTSPFFSHHHNTSTPNHHPTAQTLSHHHHSTSVPLPITIAGLPITPFLYFSVSSPFSHKPNFSQNSHFVPIFERPKAQIHPRIVPFCFLCWFFYFCRGLG